MTNPELPSAEDIKNFLRRDRPENLVPSYDAIRDVLEAISALRDDEHNYPDMGDGWCVRHQDYCAYKGMK